MARILVIDDEEMVRDMLSRALTKEGHNVVTAGDGEAGLEAFQAMDADVVVTDLIMPRQEGLETIRALHRIDPDVRVLAISGGGMRGDSLYLEFARKLGAHSVLSKPFTPDEAVDSIRALLGETAKRATRKNAADRPRRAQPS